MRVTVSSMKKTKRTDEVCTCCGCMYVRVKNEGGGGGGKGQGEEIIYIDQSLYKKLSKQQ